MGRRDPRVFLNDIAEACEEIASYTDGMTFEQYLADSKTRAAVERQFITIGEALGRLLELEPSLEDGFTAPRRIIGFRNIVVHAYAEVDDGVVWANVTKHVGVLSSEVTAILEGSR